MKKIWDEEKILLITKLFNEGKTNKEIGLVFNKKPDNISVKLIRLGLIRHKKNNYRENVICNCCGKTFVALISEKRKYCSSSCAAKVNNQSVSRKKNNKNKLCVECGKFLPTNNKNFCCRNCRVINKEKYYFDNIKNGIYVFNSKQTEEKWVKKYLIKKHGEKCMKCGWCETHPITKNIPIQMNHIDGNSDNNNLNNVELICPNCHSLTENYGSLNIGNGRSERKIKRKKTLKKQKENLLVYSSG